MKTLLTSFLVLFGLSSFSQITTWYEIPTNTDVHLNTINFGSETVGYIGGDDSLLLKTIDAGKTWSPVNFTGVNFTPGGESIVNLKFVTAEVGYMTVGPYSGTYETLDGGLTWSPVTFAGNMCYNQGLYFYSQDHGYVGGSGCFQGEHIERMIFGTMQSVTINTPSWDANDLILDIDFHDNTTFGLAASAGGRFYRTVDSGDTWDSIPAGLPAGVPVTSVEIINDTLAYAGYDDLGSGFGVMFTTDAGLTWSQDINSATFFYPSYLDVHESPNGYVYSCGQVALSDAGILIENKGPGWSYYTFEHTLNQMDSYGDSTVFAVGDSGLVVCNIDPQFLAMSESSYGQNDLDVYPVPAQSELNIKIPNHLFGQDFTVSVMDLSGKQVIQQSFSNKIDVSELQSGTYIIQLITTDERCTTKFVKE